MLDSPELLIDGPDRGARTLVLAHGAGAAMDSPFMNELAVRLASRRVRVVRFEFPFMAARRRGGSRRPPDRAPVLLDAWRSAFRAVGGRSAPVIGGKSLGGRIASMVADELGARGLVCLGYPFHPPGRTERTRTAHLAELTTPTLIVQGARDPFGVPDEVAGYDLSSSIRVEWLADGDHSFKPRVRSGHTLAAHLDQTAKLVAAFVRTLP